MAIMLPYVQKDVFGGPAGSTDQAMQQFIAGILQGAEKRRQEEQNRIASEGIKNFAQNQNVINSADSPYSPGPDDGTGLINALFSDPRLDMATKGKFGSLLNIASEMNYRKQMGEAARETARAKEPKYESISWLDKNGKYRKAQVPVGSWNNAVEQIEASGGSIVDKEPTDKKANYNTIWAFKPGDENSWTPIDYEKGGDTSLIKKMQAEGYRFRSTAPSATEKTDYLENKAQMMDDNRQHHGLIMKQFTDPLGNVIDPKGYENAKKAFEADALKIANGGKPSWATTPEPQFADPTTKSSALNFLAEKHAKLLEKGIDPMSLPSLKKATEDFVRDNPENEKLFTAKLNSMKITEQKKKSQPSTSGQAFAANPPPRAASPSPGVSQQVRGIARGLQAEENAPQATVIKPGQSTQGDRLAGRVASGVSTITGRQPMGKTVYSKEARSAPPETFFRDPKIRGKALRYEWRDGTPLAIIADTESYISAVTPEGQLIRFAKGND